MTAHSLIEAYWGGVGSAQIIASMVNSVIGLKGVEQISSGGFTGVKIAGSSLADSFDFSGIALVGIARIDGGSGNETIAGSSLVRRPLRLRQNWPQQAGTGADRLLDFDPAQDKIDLAAIDAMKWVTGNQALTFIGSAPFSKTQGELRVFVDASGVTHVQTDHDGNGSAEFEILLNSCDDNITAQRRR